ncbi:hypothetical protein L798_02965, partial [Zootermopsis nevadensis]
FSFFNVIRFRNVQCTGTNHHLGTCYSRQECTSLQGTASGSCARNWGVCCIIQKSCAATTSLNFTYFTNPEYPRAYTSSARCSITVSKCNSNICQLRVDLFELTLTQPNAEGACNVEHLDITGGASSVPVICGDNSNQHVYVDFQEDNAPIQISIRSTSAATTSHKWNIGLTQIECSSSERAPAGALMYYRELQGTVKSFNYGTSIDMDRTRQIINTNYGVFVRAASGYCSIEWTQTSGDLYSFTMTRGTDAILPSDLGTAAVAESGIDCTTDFIVIPNPFQNAMSLNTDRFCGNALLPTTTSAKPFVLTVVTNAAELPDQDNENRGFSLNYRQIPCT